MVKRLSKSRRSAILEHLLALEKQIRTEFGADKSDEHAMNSTPESGPVKRRSSSLRHGEGEDRGATLIANEFTARSMH